MRHYRFVTRGHRIFVFDASGGLVRTMPVFAGGDGTGDGGGDGGGEGAGGGKGGSGAGEGGTDPGGGSGAGGDGGGAQGGDQGPTLEQQAVDAIKALKDAGAEVPKALETAVSELKRARDDAAKSRNKGKTAAEEAAAAARESIVKDLAKALGITNEDDNDPERLKGAISDKDKTIAQREAELAEMRKERLVSKAARKEGGDEELVYAYLTTRTDFKQLDVTADGSEEQVSKMVQDAIKEKENLKMRQAPSSSGPDLGGGGSTDGKAKSLEDAVAARLAKT